MSDAPAVTAPQRLRTSREILATMRSRRRCVGSLVVTHVLVQSPDARPAGPCPRVAVVASRKVGSAVARNRAKRLLRVAARTVAWADGLDVVLVARAGTAAATAAEVSGQVLRHAEQLDAMSSTRHGGPA